MASSQLDKLKAASLSEGKLLEDMAREICRRDGFDPDECLTNDQPEWVLYMDHADGVLAIVREFDRSRLREPDGETS